MRYAIAVILIVVGSARSASAMCLDADLRFDGREPPPVAVAAMQHEAASIWNDYGVFLRWAESHDVSCLGAPKPVQIVVSNRVLDTPRPEDGRAVLGRALATGLAIEQASIHVNYAATDGMLRAFSGDQLKSMIGRPFVTPADVGRALGRVLAHEIGHVILGPHQRRGLMRPWFDVRDLVAPTRWSFALTPAEVVMLRIKERSLVD